MNHSFKRTSFKTHIPVIFCPSEEIQWIPPDLTFYQRMTLLLELAAWWAMLLLEIVLSYLPETLGLGSASPLTDVKSPVVELLSTPPRRGRRWLTDTCSMKEVPYLRKYHHSNICGGNTFRDNTFYKNNLNRWTGSHVKQWEESVHLTDLWTQVNLLDQRFVNNFCDVCLWKQ